VNKVGDRTHNLRIAAWSESAEDDEKALRSQARLFPACELAKKTKPEILLTKVQRGVTYSDLTHRETWRIYFLTKNRKVSPCRVPLGSPGVSRRDTWMDRPRSGQLAAPGNCFAAMAARLGGCENDVRWHGNERVVWCFVFSPSDSPPRGKCEASKIMYVYPWNTGDHNGWTLFSCTGDLWPSQQRMTTLVTVVSLKIATFSTKAVLPINILLTWGGCEPVFGESATYVIARVSVVSNRALILGANRKLLLLDPGPQQEKFCGHSSKKIWVPLGKLFAPPGVPSWLQAYLELAFHRTGALENEVRALRFSVTTPMVAFTNCSAGSYI